MVQRESLLDFLNNLLNLEHFKQVEDSKFNGALVEGTDDIQKIGLCVNTTFENIEESKEQDCDMVISHHGGWKQFDQDLLKSKKQEISESDITWYIAHETMDCAENIGISWVLAEKLGIKVEAQYAEHAGGRVGVYGELEVSQEEFQEKLSKIEPEYEVVGEIENLESKRIGIIGGGGGAISDLIKDTVDENCEVLIVGNSSFFGDIYAYEKGLTMIEMEETSSEKWGIYRLGEKLTEEFSEIETVKLDEKNW